jgi:hypothetical protein
MNPLSLFQAQELQNRERVSEKERQRLRDNI